MSSGTYVGRIYQDWTGVDQACNETYIEDCVDLELSITKNVGIRDHI